MFLEEGKRQRRGTDGRNYGIYKGRKEGRMEEKGVEKKISRTEVNE